MDETSNTALNGPTAFAELCRETWQESVRVEREGITERLHCARDRLAALCEWLVTACEHVFVTLIVEEEGAEWRLTYVFHPPTGGIFAEVVLRFPVSEKHVPSIASTIPAADGHEREAADLFGLIFDGHPRLGAFILHDGWPAHALPMRRGFDIARPLSRRRTGDPAEPSRGLDAPGAFAMPIGPVFSDLAEAAHFRIETLGEDASRIALRFFYKYRAVEKLAEGQPVSRVQLLAERFSGAAAFAHGLAFCQAIEEIAHVTISPRASVLRAILAELERMRSHAATITGICNSTALAVATSQAAMIEEDLLRLSAVLSGHRYFFGMLKPGGLALDIPDPACREAATRADAIARRLSRLSRLLRQSSSFLDRLEEVGATSDAAALLLGLVGPVARASAVARDIRILFPYAAYAETPPEVPTEPQGDGYARLRVFFREAEESARLIARLAADIPPGPVFLPEVSPRAGTAVGAVEAPLGAAFHFVRLDAGGRVLRYRITTPSFANWPGFQFAAEEFAFQDFPIILATFGLSNAECDR